MILAQTEAGSSILLTGLARCGTRDGGMTVSTGKSGRYRCYQCSACRRNGKIACKGGSGPMQWLDDEVMDTVIKSRPKRLERIINATEVETPTRTSARADQRKTLDAEIADLDRKMAYWVGLRTEADRLG